MVNFQFIKCIKVPLISLLKKHFWLASIFLMFAASGCNTDSADLLVTNSCYSNQWDRIGKQFYDHLKLNLANVPPEDLLPPDHKNKFKHIYDSLSLVVEGWDIHHVIDHFKVTGQLSAIVAQHFEDITTLLHGSESLQRVRC
jgi:hypothetical protein